MFFFLLWCSIGTYFVLIVFVLTFTVSVSCPLLSLGPFPLILPLCFLLIISRGPTWDPLHLSSGHNFLYDKTVIRRTSSSRVRRDFVGEAEDRRSPSIPESQELIPAVVELEARCLAGVTWLEAQEMAYCRKNGSRAAFYGSLG